MWGFVVVAFFFKKKRKSNFLSIFTYFLLILYLSPPFDKYFFSGKVNIKASIMRSALCHQTFIWPLESWAHKSDHKCNAGLQQLEFHLLNVLLSTITHPLLPSYGHCIYRHGCACPPQNVSDQLIINRQWEVGFDYLCHSEDETLVIFTLLFLLF